MKPPLRGTRESDRAQRTTSLVKALVLLALVGACVVWRVRGGAVPAAAPHVAPPHGMALVAALMVALQGIIFAYDGWTGVAYFAGELKDPGREIPRALIGGLLSTVAITGRGGSAGAGPSVGSAPGGGCCGGACGCG